MKIYQLNVLIVFRQTIISDADNSEVLKNRTIKTIELSEYPVEPIIPKHLVKVQILPKQEQQHQQS